MTEKSLYERLGGAFAIAAVVDHFSDAIVQNPIVGQQSENPQLREWHTNNLGRLPGLKLMRTLWVDRGRRPPAVRSYGARQHASGLGRSASRTQDLPRRIRRGCG